MKIATTTSDFGFYFPSDEDRIRQLHRAGFRYIDLAMFALPPDSPYMQDNWREPVARIKALAEELGMVFVQAHSPMGNPLSQDEAHVEHAVQSTIRSIEICQMLGIKDTVSHGGKIEGISKDEFFERNKAFFTRLIPTMERCGVNVLCENSSTVNSGEKYCLKNGRDMRQFIDYVDHPLFHGCWDTGHANQEGSQYDEILALGEELYAIHYNDNHGVTDDHIIPFFGRLNHDEIMNALLDVGFKGYFTLECTWTLIRYNQITGVRNRFQKEGVALKLSEPPLFMQQQLESLMYDTAKWMLEQYGLFEA